MLIYETSTKLPAKLTLNCIRWNNKKQMQLNISKFRLHKILWSNMEREAKFSYSLIELTQINEKERGLRGNKASTKALHNIHGREKNT